ncbi:methylamine utilization protein MauJ [Nonomuraea sp. AD125B]|uniref:methylamine utilization protein MauJ n=1 Tax=Nonomuraea sp. AD125B TaxID=3242897 RepID=UPI003529172C
MTDGQISDELPSIEAMKEQLPRDDARLLLEAQCRADNTSFEWEVWPLSDGYRLIAHVSIPNGRRQREYYADAAKAARLLGHNIGATAALGDLETFFFSDSETIEARVHAYDSKPRVSLRLDRLPGVQRISLESSINNVSVNSPINDEVLFSDEDVAINQRDVGWRLPLNGSTETGMAIEFGTPSARFAALSSSGTRERSDMTVLRLQGVKEHRHDALLALLQNVSDSIFFDMDVRYNVPLRLRKVTRAIRLKKNPSSGSAVDVPRMPRSTYQPKALSLYWYGRSAAGMPLLQFLAYYQVLEYYFPKYSHRELIERIRNELRDPSFKIDDDSDLTRLIRMSGQTDSGTGRERDQLKATLRACVSDDRLKSFLDDPERANFYAGQQVIRDVARIDTKNKKADLRDQAADRIYDLRCRIVHTKDDGGSKLAELLLPFSSEAERLGHDIELVRFLAQRVLVAGASAIRI